MKKNIVIAIIAFVIGCIMATCIVSENCKNQIEELSNQVAVSEEKYENFRTIGRVMVTDMLEEMEEKYDSLRDAADEMAFDLEFEGFETEEYDDRRFEDWMNEWVEDRIPYLDFIGEKFNFE